jgi:hypothetical protein
MRFVAVFLGILILSGCTSPQTYWRNNNSGANWGTDLYECTRAHSTTIISGGGTGLVGAVSAGEVGSSRTDYAMRDLCLQSRGWYQVAAPASPPPVPASPVVPPTPSPAISSAISTQDTWMFVASRGENAVWSGNWGGDAAAHSICESRRDKDAQLPTNSQWNFSACRRISVSFQEAPGARVGPFWAVVGAKAFFGRSTEQACIEQRVKFMAANPATTYGPCRQLWFSSDPDTPKENCITIYDPSGKPDHRQCNGRAVWE